MNVLRGEWPIGPPSPERDPKGRLQALGDATSSCTSSNGKIQVAVLGAVVGTASGETPAAHVLRVYEKGGSDALSALDGQFAIALNDTLHDKLVLTRDRFAAYTWYRRSGSSLKFSTRLSDIVACSSVRPQLDPPTLHTWLRDGCINPCGDSFLEEVAQAPPLLVQGLGKFSQPLATRSTGVGVEGGKGRRSAEPESVSAPHARLRELLLLSVRDIVTGKGEVSVTLSGGLDSGTIAALAKEVLGASNLHAFTFVYDESPDANRAQETARFLGLSWKPVTLQAERIAVEFFDVLKGIDQPCASPVIFADRALYRAASEQGARLVLNGHGADSLFAGSAGHVVMRAEELIKKGASIRAAQMLKQSGQPQLWKSVVGHWLPRRLVNHFRGRGRMPGVDLAWFRQQGVDTKTVPVPARSLWEQRRRELEQTMVPAVLRIEEVIADQWGCRSASPYLTNALYEFAAHLDDQQLISDDGRTKVILRSVMQGFLPDSVRLSRNRVGFPVPAARWLYQLQKWAHESIHEAARLPFLKGDYVLSTWKRFLDGHGRDQVLASRLWAWLLLWGWLEANQIPVNTGK